MQSAPNRQTPPKKSSPTGETPANKKQTQVAKDYFTLPALGYDYDSLEPVVDAETMKLHHSAHHQAYVDKLNEAIAEMGEEAFGETYAPNLDQVIRNASEYPEAVRNNAGGHWNHSFFWKLLCHPGKFSQPVADLERAIDAQFGSLEKFQAEFETAGTKHFGSGWVWLIRDHQGKLKITCTANQETPLMDTAKESGSPLLVCDLWEHAYYLKHQNKRPEFLKDFWKVLDWNRVNILWRDVVTH